LCLDDQDHGKCTQSAMKIFPNRRKRCGICRSKINIFMLGLHLLSSQFQILTVKTVYMHDMTLNPWRQLWYATGR